MLLNIKCTFLLPPSKKATMHILKVKGFQDKAQDFNESWKKWTKKSFYKTYHIVPNLLSSVSTAANILPNLLSLQHHHNIAYLPVNRESQGQEGGQLQGACRSWGGMLVPTSGILTLLMLLALGAATDAAAQCALRKKNWTQSTQPCPMHCLPV